MKRRHPYRLIDAAKVVDNLIEMCPIGTHSNWDTNKDPIVPTSERQVRPLTKLNPEEQVIAWARAIEIAKDKVPSGKIVSQVVSEMCPNRMQFKVGNRIKIKANHPLLGGYSGKIDRVNKEEAVVTLDKGKTVGISSEYIELELNSDIKPLPDEGVAYTAGMGLEYNVRLSQETWDKLNAYANEVGVASLNGAIARLLELKT